MKSIDERLAAAGVPKRHVGCSFGTFLPREGTEKAIDVAKAWVEDDRPGRGLLLVGPPGSGKTALMVAAIRARMDREMEERSREVDIAGLASREVYRRLWRPAFRVVPLLLDDLRSSIRFPDSEAETDFRFVRDDADLLVLDDLGKEKPTDWAAERIFALVEKRYGDMRSTCATTNLALDQLADNGYHALVSRLTETCDVVRMTAFDFRPEKGRSSPVDGAVTVTVHRVGSR